MEIWPQKVYRRVGGRKKPTTVPHFLRMDLTYYRLRVKGHLCHTAPDQRALLLGSDAAAQFASLKILNPMWWAQTWNLWIDFGSADSGFCGQRRGNIPQKERCGNWALIKPCVCSHLSSTLSSHTTPTSSVSLSCTRTHTQLFVLNWIFV